MFDAGIKYSSLILDVGFGFGEYFLEQNLYTA